MSGVEPRTKGTWRQVATVVDGKNIPPDLSVGMSVSADGYTITVKGKVYQRGTSKTNDLQKPRQADVVATEGPGAGDAFS
jgi:uncharacterized protein (TIGR03067 family)